MELSVASRSSRMDASVASHDPAGRRRSTLKSVGTGRRRRRPSHDKGDGSSRQDGSHYSKGSRTRMDNSSAYSSSGGGGSHRRENSGRHNSSSNTLKDQSFSTLGTMGSSVAEPSTPTTTKSSYANKYKGALAIFEAENPKPKATPTNRRPQRRASTDGSGFGSTGRRGEDRGSSSCARGSSSSPRGSYSSKNKSQLTDKYKAIGRMGRRNSLGSISIDTGDASVKSHSTSLTSRRSRGVSRTRSTSKGPEKSLTATRLKKAFSADSAGVPTPAAGASSKGPARGVRRQTSLPVDKKGGAPSRRPVERKTPINSARRSSIQSNGSVDGAMRQHRRSMRQPNDRASRTTWNTPKLKAKLSVLDFESIKEMDSSMPSLAALDLSIHSGKRKSDGSIFTASTMGDASTQASSFSRSFALPKAPSISLLMDHAQSHMSMGALDFAGEFDVSLDENSTIANSLTDIYNSSISVDTFASKTDGSQTADMNRSDQSGRLDMSRSDRGMSRSDRGSSQGPRLDGSHMGSSRMDNSRMGSSSRGSTASRRRTLSADRPRPKRNPRKDRSRGRGAKSNRRSSSRNSVRSASNEQRPERSAAMTARQLREERAVSKEKKMDSTSENGYEATAPLHRNRTTDALAPRRPKSPKSLQRSLTADHSKAPSRQKSVSSLRSADSKDSKARRKPKKSRSKSVAIPGSLEHVEEFLLWARGSSHDVDDPKDKVNKPRRRSSLAPTESLGSRNNRRGSGRKHPAPRRTMSSDSMSIDCSVSLASYDNVTIDTRKGRMSHSSSALSVDKALGARKSDATWSLADIDLGESSAPKADPDASVVTPVTVASSSAEEKRDLLTPKSKAPKLRRSKSTGSHDSSNGAAKTVQPVSNKTSAGQKAGEIKGILRTPKQNGRKPSIKKDILPSSKKAVSPLSNADKRYPLRIVSDPAADKGANIGGRQEEKEADKATAYQLSVQSLFSSNDSFGLPKPEKNNVTKPKRNSALDKESFHMTNDFGDF